MRKLHYKKVCSLVRRQPAWPFEDIEKGLCRISDNLSTNLFKREDARDIDVCVTWNNYGSRGDCGRWVEESGGRHVIMENGYLSNKYICVERAGFNGGGLEIGSDPSRFLATGLKIQPYNKNGSHILVCGQMGGTYSPLSMPNTWPDKIISELKGLTDRRIMYRPHPTRIVLPRQKVDIADLSAPLESYFEDCYAVVVYTSSVANKALLRGIPVFYDGPDIVCKEMSHKGVSKIDSPEYLPREQCFYDIAWRQWLPEEIRAGEHWEYVL